MRLEDYHFDLPPEKIALEPASPRDSAKLLVASGGQAAQDSIISDLPNWLQAGDSLVFNNSYVVPARLIGHSPSGKRVEVLLCEPIDEDSWRVMMAGKVKEVIFSTAIRATSTKAGELKFNVPFADLYAFMEEKGEVPLPPYIEKRRATAMRDKQNYQTIYHKKKEGWSSIAAPTAGLHFSDRLLAAIKEKGVHIIELTLHVGMGTFLPIRAPKIEQHQMHPEKAFLSAAAADKINQTKAAGGRVIAVGTTSLRVLESAVDEKGFVQPFHQSTDLFIYPGFRFRVADGLLTNFHLPHSTPLLLVSALMGWEKIKALYDHALTKDYRFFSYGDACFFLPEKVE